MVRNVARESLIASGDRPQVVAEQDQVGRAHRDVGAGPQREPEVGRGERGRVVDAVADHRHLLPPGLQPGDDGGLAVRQRAGDYLVDARRRGDGPRCRLVVAGQQDRMQAERAQLGDGRGRRRLDVSVTAIAPLTFPSQPTSTVVWPGSFPLPALGGQLVRDVHPALGEQPLPADDDLAAVYQAARAQSRQRPEVSGQRQPGRRRPRPVPPR